MAESQALETVPDSAFTLAVTQGRPAVEADLSIPAATSTMSWRSSRLTMQAWSFSNQAQGAAPGTALHLAWVMAPA